MIFIVVLIALLIERFFDWSHLRNLAWYGACERLVMQKIPKAPPFLVLAAVILSLIAALTLVEYLLKGELYGVPVLVFQVVVLLYCLGPRNLWADSFASTNAITKGDQQAAESKLHSSFHISVSHHSDALQRELLNQIYISANQRVFAVVFWFCILGVPGALLYRLVSVFASGAAGPEIGAAARVIAQILDWLPARIFSFLFALGGNFTRVFSCWIKRIFMGLGGNDVLVSECGLAAITSDAENIPDDGSLEKNAIALLDRVFIIVLVVIFVLAFVV